MVPPLLLRSSSTPPSPTRAPPPRRARSRWPRSGSRSPTPCSRSSSATTRRGSARASSTTCGSSSSTTCSACRSRSSPARRPARCSRALNNDVVGAQQAVTNTLGTVAAERDPPRRDAHDHAQARAGAITLLTLIVLPAFIYPARRIGPRMQKLAREGMQLNAEMNNITVERFNVAGAMLAKLFGRHDRERDAFADARGRRARHRRHAPRSTAGSCSSRSASSPRSAPRSSTSSAATSRSRGTISTGTRRRLRRCYVGADLPTARAAHELARRRPHRARVVRARVRGARLPGRRSPTSPARSTSSSREGRVELDHVWFRHPPGREVSLPSLEAPGTPGGDEPSEWILRDVSLDVEPGETVALVGPSGAGKTTIAMLVPRIYDVGAGRGPRRRSRRPRPHARVAARRDRPRAAGPAPLPRHASAPTCCSPQPDATDDDLEGALHAARIWDLVESLPDGLDTVVGERGYRMSGGEKQRLAIARLLLKDPAIVILDEATSHLDSESELAIQQALDETLARPHRDRDRAPAVDDRRRRPHRRRRRRPHRRDRARTASCCAVAACTPSCTAPRSAGRPTTSRA